MHHNRLENVPDDVTEMRELEKLWLNNNAFEEFPACVLELPKLKTVYFHDDELQQKSGKDWGNKVI